MGHDMSTLFKQWSFSPITTNVKNIFTLLMSLLMLKGNWRELLWWLKY